MMILAGEGDVNGLTVNIISIMKETSVWGARISADLWSRLEEAMKLKGFKTRAELLEYAVLKVYEEVGKDDLSVAKRALLLASKELKEAREEARTLGSPSSSFSKRHALDALFKRLGGSLSNYTEVCNRMLLELESVKGPRLSVEDLILYERLLRAEARYEEMRRRVLELVKDQSL